MRPVSVLFLLFSLALFFGYVGTVIVQSVNFDKNCSGYLARAANANTVEIARDELEKSIAYIESNKLTDGFTSIFYTTPDEDIGFWYKNIKACHSELVNLPKNTTPLESTNVLMKLRESLMSHGEKSSYITVPDGLSRYPNNGVFFVWGWVSFIMVIVSSVFTLVAFSDNRYY